MYFCPLVLISTLIISVNQIEAVTNFKALSLEEKTKIMANIDTIVTDCDGVIYNHRGVIEKANEAVEKLTEQGKRVYFVTNNSTDNITQLVRKFEKLGFVNIKKESILSAAYLAALYVSENLQTGTSVYVVGRQTVCEELQEFGIKCFGPRRDFIQETPVGMAGIRDNVGAVVVGYDKFFSCLLYTSPSPRDRTRSRMPSSA